LIGEFDVKKRSEALRSTMSLNSGRVLSTIGAFSPGACLVLSVSSSSSVADETSTLLRFDSGI
jgi:hypothetical protein